MNWRAASIFVLLVVIDFSRFDAGSVQSTILIAAEAIIVALAPWRKK